MINDATNKYLNGLGAFPTLYPDAVVPVGSYQEKVLQATNGGVPFLVNGRLALPPQFSWGTPASANRAAQHPSTPGSSAGSARRTSPSA